MGDGVYQQLWYELAKTNEGSDTDKLDHRHFGQLSDVFRLCKGDEVEALVDESRYMLHEIVQIERNYLNGAQEALHGKNGALFPSRLLIRRGAPPVYSWVSESHVRLTHEYLRKAGLLSIDYWRMLALIKVDLALQADIARIQSRFDICKTQNVLEQTRDLLDGPVLEWAESSVQEFADGHAMRQVAEKCLTMLLTQPRKDKLKGLTRHGRNIAGRVFTFNREILNEVLLEEATPLESANGINANKYLTPKGMPVLRASMHIARKWVSSYALVPFFELRDYQEKRGMFDLSKGRISVYLHLVFGGLSARSCCVLAMCCCFQLAVPLLLVLYEWRVSELTLDDEAEDGGRNETPTGLEVICAIPEWGEETKLLKAGFFFMLVIFSLRLIPRAYESVALGAGGLGRGSSGMILRKVIYARSTAWSRREGSISTWNECGLLAYQFLNGYWSFFLFGIIFFVLYLSADLVDFLVKGIALSVIDDLDEVVFASYLWPRECKDLLRAQIARLHIEGSISHGYLDEARQLLNHTRSAGDAGGQRRSAAPNVKKMAVPQKMGQSKLTSSVSHSGAPAAGEQNKAVLEAEQPPAPQIMDQSTLPKSPPNSGGPAGDLEQGQTSSCCNKQTCQELFCGCKICKKLRCKSSTRLSWSSKDVDDAFREVADSDSLKEPNPVTRDEVGCCPCCCEGLATCPVCCLPEMWIFFDRAWLLQWKVKVRGLDKASLGWATVLLCQGVLNFFLLKGGPILGIVACIYVLYCA